MPSCVIIWRVCGAGRVVFHAVSRRLYGMSSCLCMLGIGDSDIVGNILVAQRILKISLIHDIHHSHIRSDLPWRICRVILKVSLQT